MEVSAMKIRVSQKIGTWLHFVMVADRREGRREIVLLTIQPNRLWVTAF